MLPGQNRLIKITLVQKGFVISQSLFFTFKISRNKNLEYELSTRAFQAVSVSDLNFQFPLDLVLPGTNFLGIH